MNPTGRRVMLAAACLAVHMTARATTMIAGVCPPDFTRYADRGRWPAAALVTPVRVVLSLRDPAGLEALIAAQHTQSSPEFRRWRSGQELTDRFGRSAARYNHLRRWLQHAGLQIVGDSPFNLAITVKGTAAQMEAAFHVELRAVQRGTATLRTPSSEPWLPAGIAGDVATIVGLDELTTARPTARLSNGGFAMGPQDFALAYDVGALELPGRSGIGVTVGVVARSDFAMADVDAFRARFLPTASGRVRKRFVASNPGIIPSDGNIEEQEVLLDTQWAGAVAPGANIETAIGSKHGGIMESLQSLIEANAADVLSLSFALCEAETPRGYAGWVDALYALASAQGQTVVVAAGDSGDRECVRGRRRAVNVLAASPYAIAVGGTALSLTVDDEGNATAVTAERVWDDLSGSGGGGVSTLFALPAFQRDAGLTANGRMLPDLALAASVITPGYTIVRRGHFDGVGGTSAGTPALAGLLARAIERRGSRLGHILPTLYHLTPAAFRDITEGSNGFPATDGFDLASGRGSPRGTAFVDGLAAGTPSLCTPLLDFLVPGNGPASQRCAVEWRLDMMHPARVVVTAGYPVGAPRRQQVCHDGDPACDQDGLADGICTVALGVCLNVTDPRNATQRHHPRCGAGRIRALAIRRSPQGNDPLTDAVANLPLPVTKRATCSELTAVPIPVGSSPTRWTIRASRRGGVSRATLRLRCVP